MIALGVVGWDDSVEAAQEDDIATGVSLVRVTLVNDHDVLASLQDGKAFGKQIVCQSMGTLGQNYEPGVRVVVAIPEGLEAAPGAAVLLGVLARPTTDYVALAQKTLDEIRAVRDKLNTAIIAINTHVHLETGGTTAVPTTGTGGIPVSAPAAVNSVAAAESRAR